MKLYRTKTEGTSSNLKLPASFLPDWSEAGEIWLFPLHMVVDLPIEAYANMQAWGVAQIEGESRWGDAIDRILKELAESETGELRSAVIFRTEFKKVDKDQFFRIYIPSPFAPLEWIEKGENIIVVKVSSGLTIWSKSAYQALTVGDYETN